MRGRNLHVSLLLLLVPAFCLSSPLFTLIAPNILHAGSDETIVLQAHNFNQNIKVDIKVFDFPKKTRSLYGGSVTLQGKDLFVSTTINIKTDLISEDPKEKQFVYLEAASHPHFALEKVIMLSSFPGYLFTQTDKPIYTPLQKVRYAVFSIDKKMDPQSTPVIIEIQNPANITVQSDTIFISSRIEQREYKLSDLVSLGTWKIITKYKNAPQRTYSTEFEVKEYVLPNIDVTLEPNKKFFHVNEKELEIKITANYIFKKQVDGRALALFGVKRDGQRRNIPTSFQRIDITYGEGTAKLTDKMLTDTFGSVSELLDAEIIVDVTVFTPGGDTAQAEKLGIKIVKSPYEISFIRTPKYFKPVTPLHFWVLVTNPDGSPAPDISLETSEKSEGKTNKEGITQFQVTSKTQKEKEMVINVKTKQKELTDDQQARATMTVTAYNSISGNYLHLDAGQVEVEVGTDVKISLIAKTANDAIAKQIKYYTYMILNKGRIVKIASETQFDGQTFITFSITVGPELLPAFRVVAYYAVIGTDSKYQIIADSAWIKVKESCMGKLELRDARENFKGMIYQPHQEFRLMLEGDEGAQVILVAVDKAVFALNKNRFSQKKIWNVIGKSDLGCTPGSGADSMGVFSDAGLVFVTNKDHVTAARQELHCPEQVKRKRRSLNIIESKKRKVDEYDTPEEKLCCEDGMRENPMGHKCEERARHISLGQKCIAAFLTCCKHAEKLTEEEREELILARSGEECEECIDMDMDFRSYFPESFIWTIVTLNKSKGNGLATHIKSVHLPDSITTWELQAVSLTKNKGICVSEPYEVTVRKTFFIDLQLPYSAQRNEQVEIRVILYNYALFSIRVNVVLLYHQHLCSLSKPRKNYQQSVEVPAASSASVSFIVVPLIVGNINVEVGAVVPFLLIRDGIRKQLQVVPGGIIKRKSKSILLDPKGRSQTEIIQYTDFEGLVPDTEPQTLISVQGNLIAETLLNSLDPSRLTELIRIPSGCVEQTILGMATNVILTHYMDKTNQWDLLGVDSRKKAVENIKTGYAQQLTYIKVDKSFRPYRGSQSGTWLTAYIAKIFAMAYSIIGNQQSEVCGSVKWLILNTQKPDGVFVENAPVYTRAMQGGFIGSEEHASLTAFVLIALKEAEEICQSRITSLPESIKKAKDYLEKQLNNLKNTYSVAITSYALALVDSTKADNVLDKFSSSDKTHWPVARNKDSLYTVEATAYALLHAMKLKKYERAHAIADWLVRRREYGGGQASTQATVIGLQALAEYMTGIPEKKATNLEVHVGVEGREKAISYVITDSNLYVARSEQFLAIKKINVTVSGSGQGTLSVSICLINISKH
ncbi:venom factor-like [Protopterus annectens]|uniref:venom factor-like n=1 Tax=Protopterus annectens TaxID=7888 RepID=UPI001CFC11DC|nr:venom factor-like [Protopterus annectens]